MTTPPRPRREIDIEWLREHSETSMSEMPLMTSLILCQSLAGRLHTPADLAVIRQRRSPLDLLRWFADEVARSGGRSRPSPMPRVRLRPVSEADLPAVYQAWCDPDAGASWIARGATPSWHEFPALMWSGVDSAFIAEDVITGDPAALVVSYGYDTNSLCVFAGVVGLTGRDGVALGCEAILRLMAKLFSDRPIRRIVLEVPEYNWWMVDGVIADGPIPTIPEHQFHRGRWWDVSLISLDRSGFDELTAIDRVDTTDLVSLAQELAASAGR